MASGNNYEGAETYFNVKAEFIKELNEQTWKEIDRAAKAGQAANYWSVGDTKSIDFNGQTYLVQIIGFDHDDVVDVSAYGRNKAGVTFQFGKANSNVKGQYGMYSEFAQMNSSSTNAGGWTSSAMRKTTMRQMKDFLPAELSALIVDVTKKTSEGSASTTINTSQDDLWLLSEVEIFGTTTYSVAGEGKQYQFYKNGNNTVRYNTSGSAYIWWERSPRSSTRSYFCRVYTNGNAAFESADTSRGVSFGFCL